MNAQTQERGLTPLRSLNQLVTSNDSRAPHANVTNAAYLMGDVDEFHKSDYGDPDNFSALSTYEALMGDADYGDLRSVWKKIPKGVKYGAAALGTAGLTYLTFDQIRKAKNKIVAGRRARQAAQQAAANNTIYNQDAARTMLGKIPRNAHMPYYQITGATLNSFPLSPDNFFVADTLKYNLDRQSTDTPFEVEIQSAVFAGSTWTITASGTVAPRYYAVVFITVGISVLSAAPGTIFNVSGILPTINGNLVIASNPFSYTLQSGYYAKKALFPWVMVTNKPQLALGQYSNANPIVITINGLPSNAAVSMIVPGSLHQWTTAMRNRLL